MVVSGSRFFSRVISRCGAAHPGFWIRVTLVGYGSGSGFQNYRERISIRLCRKKKVIGQFIRLDFIRIRISFFSELGSGSGSGFFFKVRSGSVFLLLEYRILVSITRLVLPLQGNFSTRYPR